MANISIGILGLPNVGKSTLFGALTSVSVPAENYPFCTIDPNVGVVEVPDERLARLFEVARTPAKVPTVIEFVDIAGLVRGASKGEGLGNRFLTNVREADALAHVVRVFEDDSVVRAGDSTDPVADLDTIDTELALSDLEIVERRIDRAARRARSGDREAAAELKVLEAVGDVLDQGKPARALGLDEEGRSVLRPLNLLTRKPMMIVLNVGEDAIEEEGETERGVRRAAAERDPGARVVRISAAVEAEIAQLAAAERHEYLAELGLGESGLDRLVQAGYRLLGLETFFTIGDNEVRAWTIEIGATAPEAAGKVHTDMQRGFIRAETIPWDDFVRVGSYREARERGLLRSEGRDYVVADGDVLLFRFNV